MNDHLPAPLRSFTGSLLGNPKPFREGIGVLPRKIVSARPVYLPKAWHEDIGFALIYFFEHRTPNTD